MGDIDIPLGGFMAIDWSLLTLALAFVLLRLWIRRRRPVDAGGSMASEISDAAVVAAWLSGFVLVAINTWKNSERMRYVHWPQDKLYYGVPYDKAGHLLMVSWVSLYAIYISLWLSKASFIAFYYHLFPNTCIWSQVIKAFVAVFAALTFILHMCLLTFWCHPIDLNWATNDHLCSAVHNMTSVTISTFANVGTDLLIILLPLLVLKQLNFQRAQVAVYIFVLSIGSVSILAALVRYGALRAVWGQPKVDITHTIDVWGIVEIVASILACCAPSFRLLIKQRKRHSRLLGDDRSEKRMNQVTEVQAWTVVDGRVALERLGTLKIEG